MAIERKPKYQTVLPLEKLAAEQFLVIGVDAARQLGWQIGYLAPNGFIAQTPVVSNSWLGLVEIKVENGVAEIRCSSVNGAFYDKGNNKKSVEAFVALFHEKRLQVSNEEMAARYHFIVEYNQFNAADISQVAIPGKDPYPDVVDLFIPRKNYFITPLLIDANLLVFLIMALTGVSIMEPDTASLLRWGGNFRPLTMNGEWWRLLSCVFLHFGVIHLIMNMYALFFIGLLLEPHLGRSRYLTAYLLTGISASAVSLWWHTNTISAGASGAIFGMYGVFLALLTTNMIERKTRRIQLISIIFFVGYNLLNGLKEGIDNAAHLGGLISGILIGYLLIPGLRKRAKIGSE